MSVLAPSATQPGTPATCQGFRITAKQGDTCFGIAAQKHISVAAFLKANPQLSNDCVKNLWEGYPYCVPTVSLASTAPSTSPYNPPPAYFPSGGARASAQPNTYAYTERGANPATVAPQNGSYIVPGLTSHTTTSVLSPSSTTIVTISVTTSQALSPTTKPPSGDTTGTFFTLSQ